jgi:hypothetical protein
MSSLQEALDVLQTCFSGGPSPSQLGEGVNGSRGHTVICVTVVTENEVRCMSAHTCDCERYGRL